MTVSHRRPEAMIKITITLPVIPDTVVYATTSDEATCAGSHVSDVTIFLTRSDMR